MWSEPACPSLKMRVPHPLVQWGRHYTSGQRNRENLCFCYCLVGLTERLFPHYTAGVSENGLKLSYWSTVFISPTYWVYFGIKNNHVISPTPQFILDHLTVTNNKWHSINIQVYTCELRNEIFYFQARLISLSRMQGSTLLVWIFVMVVGFDSVKWKIFFMHQIINTFPKQLPWEEKNTYTHKNPPKRCQWNNTLLTLNQ